MLNVSSKRFWLLMFLAAFSVPAALVFLSVKKLYDNGKDRPWIIGGSIGAALAFWGYFGIQEHHEIGFFNFAFVTNVVNYLFGAAVEYDFGGTWFWNKLLISLFQGCCIGAVVSFVVNELVQWRDKRNLIASKK